MSSQEPDEIESLLHDDGNLDSSQAGIDKNYCLNVLGDADGETIFCGAEIPQHSQMCKICLTTKRRATGLQ